MSRPDGSNALLGSRPLWAVVFGAPAGYRIRSVLGKDSRSVARPVSNSRMGRLMQTRMGPSGMNSACLDMSGKWAASKGLVHLNALEHGGSSLTPEQETDLKMAPDQRSTTFLQSHQRWTRESDTP